MTDILTFPQCLRQLMKQHGFSSAQLGALVDERIEIKHILSGNASAQKCRSFYDKLQLSSLFSAEESRQLEDALEVSRIGADACRFRLAVDRILCGKSPESASEICLDDGAALAERLMPLKDADKIRILCFNACTPSLIQALLPLFEDPDRDISMVHLLHLAAYKRNTATLVSSILPLIFDERYQPYGMAETAGSLQGLGGSFVCISSETDGQASQMFFVFLNHERAAEMPDADKADMYRFLSDLFKKLDPPPTPLKESPVSKEDFTSLCMTFLSHELNRSTFYFSNDLCFQQVPVEIAIRALRDKGMFSEEEIAQIIQRTLTLHEQRHQNLYNKKKKTCLVMTPAGCRRFLETGYTTDHFFAFRSFTPQERMQIFGKMIKSAQTNPNFVPLLLKDPNFRYRYNLVCYEKLGVSFDEMDTDYDISNGYRSIFLMFPHFTQQYMDYYLKTLVVDRCLSREDSLAALGKMYQQFLEENGLTDS